MLKITTQPSLASNLVSLNLRPLSIGVIGCGYWGPNHVRCLQSVPACQVIAIDKSEDRLQRLQTEFPMVRTGSDWRTLLHDPEVDALIIATPTSTHAALVREALQAGKHVLCEKPLCLKAKEARELSAIAQSNGLVLMTGHIFLFNAGLIKIKDMVDSGELGNILYVSSERTNFGPIRDDVNAAYDLAAHDISVFNWFIGENPIEVSATGGTFVRRGIQDVVFITLKYQGGQCAHVHASWLNPHKVRKLTLVGDRRMVAWNDLDNATPVAIFDRGAMLQADPNNFGEFQRETMWDGEVRLPKIDSAEPLKIQDRAFIDAIRMGGAYRSDGPFSVGVVQTLEMVSISLAKGGSPVTLSEIAGGK